MRLTGKPVEWCRKGMIFEQKYELDSLAAVLKLAVSATSFVFSTHTLHTP
jgi:meiotically up-regulated gene 157 (Mug157) protein